MQNCKKYCCASQTRKWWYAFFYIKTHHPIVSSQQLARVLKVFVSQHHFVQTHVYLAQIDHQVILEHAILYQLGNQESTGNVRRLPPPKSGWSFLFWRILLKDPSTLLICMGKDGKHRYQKRKGLWGNSWEPTPSGRAKEELSGAHKASTKLLANRASVGKGNMAHSHCSRLGGGGWWVNRWFWRGFGPLLWQPLWCWTSVFIAYLSYWDKSSLLILSKVSVMISALNPLVVDWRRTCVWSCATLCRVRCHDVGRALNGFAIKQLEGLCIAKYKWEESILKGIWCVRVEFLH